MKTAFRQLGAVFYMRCKPAGMPA